MKRQRRNEILVKQVVDRLKTVRRERGLTQENVRFDTDLNIGRIESGRHSISLTTLMICAIITMFLWRISSRR